MGETEFTSRSDYDGFGRKSFDELKLGKGFISRQFSYHAGKVTEAHKNNDKLQSAPVTQLVSQIILSDGRTLNYEYDKEERVTKVIDSIEGTTEYGETRGRFYCPPCVPSLIKKVNKVKVKITKR